MRINEVLFFTLTAMKAIILHFLKIYFAIHQLTGKDIQIQY